MYVPLIFLLSFIFAGGAVFSFKQYRTAVRGKPETKANSLSLPPPPEGYIPTPNTEKEENAKVSSKNKKGKEKMDQYEVINITTDGHKRGLEELLRNDKKYKGSRFLKSRGFFGSMRKYVVVNKVTEDFISAKNEDQTPTFTTKPVTLEDKVSISSSLLFKVESSSSLRRALSSLFNKPFGLNLGGKKVLFIGVIIIVAVVAYMIYSGYLKI